MRQIDDAHDPENQAEPRCDQKENRSIGQRVQQLDRQYRHRRYPLNLLFATRRGATARIPAPASLREAPSPAVRVWVSTVFVAPLPHCGRGGTQPAGLGG